MCWEWSTVLEEGDVCYCEEFVPTMQDSVPLRSIPESLISGTFEVCRSKICDCKIVVDPCGG